MTTELARAWHNVWFERLEDLQRRQREVFAAEYARAAAAEAHDPQREDEDCTDMG